MSWLKHTISFLLVVAAVAIALATGFGDHASDYGKVALPQGGVVHLPDGKVIVYYSRLGGSSQSASPATGSFNFQVVPVGGGPPVVMNAAGGTVSAEGAQGSDQIGEVGAVAKLEVPVAGDYAVSGSTDSASGTSGLEFGTNAGAAVLRRWHLLAGLLIGAFLIALIPTRRSKRRWEDDAGASSGWSSNPRAPYAG
jgi:hypothetical protein